MDSTDSSFSFPRFVPDRKAIIASNLLTLPSNSIRGLLASHPLTLQPVGEGLSGTYFVVAPNREPIAVYKPSRQEIGMDRNPKENYEPKPGFPPGEGYKREVAAYLLDHGHRAQVPMTFQAELVEGLGVGSVQEFITNDSTGRPCHCTTESVHHIGIFDLRTLNCDRHDKNFLFVRQGTQLHMIPIDHGCILPEGYHALDDMQLFWMYLEQSKEPFSPSTLACIDSLDAEADVKLLKERIGFPDSVTDNLKAGTLLLQHCAKVGYTLREIGELCLRQHYQHPSWLEHALQICRHPAGAMNWDMYRSHILRTIWHSGVVEECHTVRNDEPCQPEPITIHMDLKRL